MKAKDVVIGMHCWVKVGPCRVLCVVHDQETNYDGKVVYVMQRLDTGKYLPIKRSAAKLHAKARG